MRLLFSVFAVMCAFACTKPEATSRPSKTYVLSGGTKVEFTQMEIKFQPPAPNYPAEAKALGIQGMVVAMIIVGPDGTPIRVEINSGPNELRAAAVEYAMRWRFLPALLNGKPEIAQFKLDIPFTLN